MTGVRFTFSIQSPNGRVRSGQKKVKRSQKKLRQQKAASKVMLIAFFDCRGMVYDHFCPPNTRVTSLYYLKALKQLTKHINQKRPDIRYNWCFHQDNAIPHILGNVIAWLASRNIDTMVHPPYSPDLALCDY